MGRNIFESNQIPKRSAPAEPFNAHPDLVDLVGEEYDHDFGQFVSMKDKKERIVLLKESSKEEPQH